MDRLQQCGAKKILEKTKRAIINYFKNWYAKKVVLCIWNWKESCTSFFCTTRHWIWTSTIFN